MCRCSASLNSASETEASTTFEDSEDESESTYAFSTLDSDFIAWMRLSVKNVPASHPCYSSRQAEALATLTRQEVVNIVSIFNTNPLGLRMSLVSYGFLPLNFPIVTVTLTDIFGSIYEITVP